MLSRRRQNRRVDQVPADEKVKRPVNWLSIVVLFIAVDILALVIWTGLRIADPAAVPVREVQVRGEFRHLQPAQLRTVVTEHLHGSFFTVDVAAIREAVLQEPWVQDVAVGRLWPDTLQVTVFERRAVARWGNEGLLDANGVLFRPPQVSYPEGLVLLEGPTGSERQVLQRLTLLRDLLRGGNQVVTELLLNQRRSWSFVLRDGPVVHVGRSDFEARVRRFAEHYAEVLTGSAGKIKRVDLRYTNGFAVSMDARNSDHNG